jgi:hypothetical protein
MLRNPGNIGANIHAPQEAVLEMSNDRRFVTVKKDRSHWAMGILEEEIANLEV